MPNALSAGLPPTPLNNTATVMEDKKIYKLPRLVDEVDFSEYIDEAIPENERALLRWENVSFFVPSKKPDTV